jgi:ATP synthase F1 gamma subunit
MGKVARIKGDLDDVEALIEIISILKDVSTNRFFVFAQQKTEFTKFLEVFLIFFNLLEGIETECPLVRNDNPGTDIVVVTSEASFMSQLNSRVCNAAYAEFQKQKDAKIICVGFRGGEKCRQLGMPVEKVYTNVEEPSRYDTALNIRDLLIERIMSGQAGKAVCLYTWPKSFNVLKPRIIKLLPASELLGGDEAMVADDESRKKLRLGKDFLQESSIDGIMKVLADIWVSSRLFELLTDTKIAEAAAQAQQLESAVESLGSEKKGLVLSFRKASRDELNKAMSEVFSAAKVIRRR